MKLIVGLGNPGAKYELTRHNAGFLLIDQLADANGISVTSTKFHGQYGRGRVMGEDAVLLKPETFMNLSGKSVIPALQFFKIPADQLIVLHDDLDMESGKVKAKFGGGHGGHNGIRDIMAQLGHGNFHRLKIGIGRPAAGGGKASEKGGRVTGWVLGPYDQQDLDDLAGPVFDDIKLRLEQIFKKDR